MAQLGPADVVFAEATPEQRELSWKLNAPSWAPPLSVADYLGRERHLAQQDLSRNGGCRYWVLHLKSNPITIVASCETLRRPALIASRSADGISPPSVRRGFGYGIASVYTNPDYRRRGMAALLLNKVQQFMDNDGADCSVLYSDIGKHYYSNLGWNVFPSDQATLHLLSSPPSLEPGPNSGLEPFAQTSPEATQPLTKDSLLQFCAADEAELEARLSAPPTANGGDNDEEEGSTRIAFLPTVDQISWQLAREGFITQAMFGVPLTRRGAATADGKAWISWIHDWKEKKLKVMRLVTTHGDEAAAERVEALTALLEAALAEASAWGLLQVLVWNPDGKTTVACKAVGNAHEDTVKLIMDERPSESIPSLRWKNGADTQDTVWIDNQCYCWC